MRANRRERRVRIEGVLPLKSGARDVVHVRRESPIAREGLLVSPRDGEIRSPVPLPCIGRCDVSVQKSIEPVIPPFAVELCPSGIALDGSGAAPPVEPRRRIHVVVDHPEVANVLDVAAVRWIVPNDVGHTEARREYAAMPPRSHVGEHERQPHHRDVFDVQNRRARDERVAARALDFVELEPVVGDGIGATRQLAAEAVERRPASRRGVAKNRLPLPGTDLPELAGVRGEPGVGDGRRAIVEAVHQTSAADEIRLAAVCVVDDDVAARLSDLCILVEIDPGVGNDRLRVSTLNDRALQVAGDDLKELMFGVECDACPLVSRDRVALSVQQRLRHRIGRRQSKARRICAIGGRRIAANGVAGRRSRCLRQSRGPYLGSDAGGERGKRYQRHERRPCALLHAGSPADRSASNSASRRALLRWIRYATATLSSYSK